MKDDIREWQKTDVVQAGIPPVLAGAIEAMNDVESSQQLCYAWACEYLFSHAIFLTINLRHRIQ